MLKGVFLRLSYLRALCTRSEGGSNSWLHDVSPGGRRPDADHAFSVRRIEDDWYVTLSHPMTEITTLALWHMRLWNGICFRSSIQSQSVQPLPYYRARQDIFCNALDSLRR